MTRALVSLLGGLIALIATRSAVRAMLPRASLVATNYRGLPIPTAMGMTVLAGTLAGTALVSLLIELAPRSSVLGQSAGSAVPLVALAVGFGLVGLWDDVASDQERGFGGHIRALRRRRLTGGGMKMVAGASVAIVVVAPASDGIGWALLHGGIVALLANIYNSLDLRPGRAGKFFILAALPLTLVSEASAVLAAAIGSMMAFLPNDLRERAMLGDVGANALGALIGGAVVFAGPPAGVRLALLAGAVLLTVLSERPGFSRLIAAVPPLRGLDRAGRIEERSPAED